MFSTFTRYIIRELLRVFLITLTAMTVLMLLVVVVQEAVRENLTPWTIVRLIPFFLPNALCFAIPGTVLFATCMVLGRMSSANEIVAIKSIGVSPMAAIWPVAILAFLLSLVTVILNDFAVSWGRQGVYRVVLRSVEKTIYSVLSSEGSYQNGRVSIFVEDVDDTQLIRPVVQIFSGGHSGNDLHFSAERAELYVDGERDMLVFKVVNAQAKYSGENLNAVWPDGEVAIPLKDVIKKGDRSNNPSNLPMRAMRAERQKQNQEVETQRRQLAMKAAFQMFGGVISLV